MLDNSNDILTPVEAAAALHIGRNSIYELIKSGELSAIKIGRKIVIPKIYILDFIEKNR